MKHNLTVPPPFHLEVGPLKSSWVSGGAL